MEPQDQDAEMASSPSSMESSHSAPSSPTLSARTDDMPTSNIPPAPPLPPLTPRPVLLPSDSNKDEQVITNFIGTLESFLRSAARQKKWALVLVLPKATPSPRPSASTYSPSSPASRRPAWGDNAYHQPKKLYAKNQIADNISLWRRTESSQDSQRYTAFFPVDGLPHLALLDPRSGERLAVWGNEDGENMADGGISQAFWEGALSDVEEFLKTHSLEDGALGPMHRREKEWVVSTRRVTPGTSPSIGAMRSTAVMDDEEAAIAAAIAASLAESRPVESVESASESESEDEMYSSDGMTQEDEEDTSEDGVRDDTPTRAASMPVTIPSRGREPTPSSVESLSNSYVERMESCLRSSTNPLLAESRRLRQEQDNELARSLQEDRRREEEEAAMAAEEASKEAQQQAARARLPEEPEAGPGVCTIAIRLPGGGRIARRFATEDLLRRVGDFVIGEVGCCSVLDRKPADVFKMAGGGVQGGWESKLGELGLGSRMMFILNAEM